MSLEPLEEEIAGLAADVSEVMEGVQFAAALSGVATWLMAQLAAFDDPVLTSGAAQALRALADDLDSIERTTSTLQ